ncbi:ABC transporter substrate-binding protein [Paenibacillus oceani]|uniref:Extracellular solute-binding protein n=1 Tax=Paenibacillus oceani TaxID=2772510 RepID=A0A927H217_9BACL|nr:extracellular solute-binding protein [Paenibacillus oceani]MBD2864903.1 extracellular solute-binding protein [Paenibacillus oceani]
MFKKMLVSISIGMLTVSLAACSGNKQDEAGNGQGQSPEPAPRAVETEKKPEPVTLSVFAGPGSFSVDEFKSYFVPAIEKKFPHITLEYVTGNPAQMLAAGSFPDIGMGGIGGLIGWKELALPLDLNEPAKKRQADLNVYHKEGLNAIRTYSDRGELFALPMWINVYATLYNKDIFDKFGAAYLTDGMTWEQMKEIAVKLTRNVDGEQYRGLSIGGIDLLGEQKRLKIVDEKTNKAVFHTDEWNKIFQLGKDIVSIPGNGVANPTQIWRDSPAFFDTGKLAIVPYFGSMVTKAATLTQENKMTFQWDIVSYPVHKDYPGMGPQFDAQVYFVSRTSKHQEQAFDVIYHMTSNPEVQTRIANIAKARPSIQLATPVEQLYGTQFPVLKDKNVKGIFKTIPTERNTTTPYNALSSAALLRGFAAYVTGTEDVNTVLRKAQDEANAEIEVKKSQKKE